MEKPVIAQKSPIPVELKKGETYYWCTCGKSSTQPFCNGAHEGTSFKPMAFTAEKDETAYFVHANILRILPTVMELMINFNTIDRCTSVNL